MAKTAITPTMPAVAPKPANGRRKHAQATDAAQSAVAAVVLAVSAKTRHLIDAIREDFTAFADGFASITASRAELAPRFMKAFAAWAQETGSTFAAFVRVLDSSVPEDRDGYRAHPSYQAADYLRRLGAGQAREPLPENERPATAYQALAYLVATVMPIVDPSGTIWNAFTKEMHWTPEQSERIKVMAAKVGPVQLPPRVKGQLTHLSRSA